MLVVIAVTVLVAMVVMTRLVYILHAIHQGKPLVLPKHKTVKTLVILGSGGHTVEMLKMVDALDPKKYNPRIYVVADTDEISHKKLLEVEKNFKVCLSCLLQFRLFSIRFHVIKLFLHACRLINNTNGVDFILDSHCIFRSLYSS